MAIEAEKKKTNNKPINTSLISIDADQIKHVLKKYRGFNAIVVIIIAIGLYCSDLWPWPSKERIQNHMDAVLEACNGNENSSNCKDFLQRYNMTFKYCSNLADYTMLERKYPNISDQLEHIGELSLYGVVWEGKSENPPETTYKINGQTMTQPSTYYHCRDHAE